MNRTVVLLETGDPWATFAREMFDHLRLAYAPRAAGDLASSLDDAGVLLIPSAATLDEASVHRVGDWVRSGGALICCGGAGALGPLAGVEDADSVPDGHIRIDPDVPWAARFDVMLHAFGGRVVRSLDDVEVLARWIDGSPAVTRRAVGAGSVTVLGPDVWQSVGRIQQGWPVTGPGHPADDGSAPVGADDILRCDDGLALDYVADRALPDGSTPEGAYPASYPPITPVPVFHRAHADLWRELVLQLLRDAAASGSVPLAWLHFWPSGVDAVGHMSHDADQNKDEHARLALDAFADAGVRVSWCHCWPGGYSADVIEAIGAAGHEHALHYNALDIDDGMPWGESGMAEQKAWAEALVGGPVVVNKNHYTRWEGWTEFFGWCDDLGIELDQTRGPSKPGTVGFPYGTTHVGFPVDADGRRFDVLSMPLHTQDVGYQSHEDVIDVILDEALARHGIAHFLFHGTNMVGNQRVARAVRRAAEAGRARSMPWWTAGEINSYERLRRGVDIEVASRPDEVVLSIRSSSPLSEAGLVVDLPGRAEDWQAALDGTRLPVADVQRAGRHALEITLDLPAGPTQIVLTRHGLTE